MYVNKDEFAPKSLKMQCKDSTGTTYNSNSFNIAIYDYCYQNAQKTSGKFTSLSYSQNDTNSTANTIDINDIPSSYLKLATDPNVSPAKPWHQSQKCKFKSCQWYTASSTICSTTLASNP